MTESNQQHGSCFCGAVTLTVTGQPDVMGYCHCDSCRQWSAGPVNAFTLWQPDKVEITQGQDKLLSYNKTPNSTRKWCKECGGHVLSEHPGINMIDVFSATIPDFKFEPAIHVHYQESVLSIKDGLPKFKDLPADAGGSGDIVDE